MLRIDQRGAMGIGAMIIFIAMVLVAGIAAYVILTTSNQLQMKSSSTGIQTISEVSSGVKISTIEGHNTSGKIDKMVIMITPRAGSPVISIASTIMEVSNSSTKYILKYSSTYWVDGTAGLTDLFKTNTFSPVADEFGLIVIKDDDHSCIQNLPILTKDDNVMLTVNTTAIFNGILQNENILGNVIPNQGSWGIIQFRAPSAFGQEVFILQEG